MKKLLVALIVCMPFGCSLIANGETCYEWEGSVCIKLMEMDDVSDAVKEMALMYRGIEMDIEDLEDEMEEVKELKEDVKELKEMVKDLNETCKKIKNEVCRR